MLNGIPLRLTSMKNTIPTIAETAAVAILFAIGIGIIQAPPVRAQAPTAETPKWEAASVKRCNNEPGGKQGRPPLNSPNRIRLSCYPLAQLIRNSYVQFAGGHWNGSHPGSVRIEQLPGWSNSERYTLDAKAEGSPGQMMMLGPMLQTMLENRFALKIHSESRDEPAYELTVAKRGFKVQPFNGDCTPESPLSQDPTPAKDACPRTPQDWPMSLDTFAWWLNGLPRTLDAPVINKTGIAGYFRFDWKPFQALNPPPFVVPPEQVIESAIAAFEDLGLKLERTKAPRQHLVVDHVERPSEN
jgi:uncharacterized protein (TIGR03435 family)